MGEVIGIDLGTTNSCVAVLEKRGPVVVPNPQGLRTTPSMVAYTKSGDVLVGVPAQRQAVTNAEGTIFGIKRLIGRKYNDAELSTYMQQLPYETVSATNGDAWVAAGGDRRSPQEVSAEILSALKKMAEEYLNKEVTDAVITVPAYFNDQQRQATKDAARIAGLNVRRIINEPTAAALAYGYDKKRPGRLAVFDFGGGTFDISILEVDENTVEVLASGGDNLLGGDDIDQALIADLLHEFEDEHGVDISAQADALQRLKEAAVQAKHELSAARTVSVNLPFITQHEGQPLHLLREEMRRSTLELLVTDILDRIELPCHETLSAAGLEPSDIDAVLLVGGVTRMPAVREKAEEIFGKPPSVDVHPDEAVALGAALQAAVLDGDLDDDILLMDVTAFSLGIKVRGGRFSKLIERNETIPCREKKLFAPVEDGQQFVTLQIYQGESQLVKDNTYLGSVTLSGLTNTAQGKARVEVTFTLDADGTLSVDATDLHTSKKASVDLRPSSGLTPDQLEALIESGKARRVPRAES